MDKPLPKIGGITIERVLKAGAPPSNITSGKSNQSSSVATPSKSLEATDFDAQIDEDYHEDEYYDDYHEGDVEGEQWQDGADDEGALGEEEEDEEMAYNDSDQMEDSITNEPLMSSHDVAEPEVNVPTGPMLPPGVTFERKKPATATIKPNIKLPPGISLSKPSSSQAPARAPPKQNFPNQRSFPPRPSQQIVYPRQNTAVSRPAPPVRAVRPRAKMEPPRMMINDFLEQGMHIGGSAMTFPGRGRPRAPRAVISQPPRARMPKLPFPIGGWGWAGAPRSPAKTRNTPQKRQQLGAQKAPIPIESLLNLTAQSDSEDDLPLRPSKSLPGFKLPPGINLERKTASTAKPSAQSDIIKLPLIANSSKEKSVPPQPRFPPNIQLPAGISLERKKPVTSSLQVESSDFEDEGEDIEEGFEDEYSEDHEENMDEPDQYDEAGVNPVAPAPLSIQLPPGVSLQKRSTGNRPEAPSIQSTSQPEVRSDRQPDESVEEHEKAESSAEGIDQGHEEDAYDYEADEGEEFDEDGVEGEDEMEDETGNNDEWNESHENDPADQEEMLQDKDEGDDAFENRENDDQMTDKYHLEESELHDAEKPVEENEEKVAAPESMDPSLGDEAEGEENDGMGEDADLLGEENQNQSEMPGGFDPSAEIDFETLIAAPMIPTVSSLSTTAEDMKTDLDEKADLENFMEMMSKGEIEGEIEEDEEDKKVEKRKAEEEEEMDGESESKKMKEGEENEREGEEKDKDIDTVNVASSHLRKNIREVMDETKLDETTLAAQRQEVERLKRLSEQQRILKEVKRQIQMSKMADKAQNQSNVLNLLRGNSDLTLKKSGSSITSSSSAASTAGRSQDSVLLKMGNGQQACLNDKMRDILKKQGSSSPSELTSRAFLNKAMLSSSVTIAPIKKEPGDEKSKSKDVVELSSDSDDCVVLSEEDSEPDDDPTNSGMHTSDEYNIADQHGRVLVNVGHPLEEPDVFLAPQIASIIKPHQIGGVRFLYDNIIESSERYESSAGFGCILAHSMGLGKTLQIVSFSDIFLRHTSAKKILCIMPINTIQNWQAEYNMWLPKENLSGGDIRCREFDVYVVNESSKNMHSRGKVILEWHKNGGVLLMGYELFRLLSLRKPIKSKRKIPNEDEDKKNRDLVQDVYAALVNPGPDLVICDEGHRIKNSHATTSQALKLIRTRRRVVLTGYPLQNNLLEYWCMVDFVRPNYLGSKTEFSNMFERPIQNGQCIDSTPQDKRLMRYRAHVLHSQLEGFVQRRSHKVLQQVLPHKQEYVFMLRFTEFQSKLYKTFMNEVVRAVAVPNPLKAFAVCCKIWNHPDVLYNVLKKKGEQRDLDLEETLLPPTIPPPFGGDALAALTAAKPLPNPNWPKKGPGSRGGKIRQRKQAKGSPPNALAPKEPIEALPSMSQFQMPNAASRSRPPTTYPGGSSSYLPETPYSQPLPSFSQTQQTEMKYPYGNNGNQGDSHGNFSEFDESKQSYGSGFNQDPYYQSQFPQTSRQEQYYQQGNPNYDYNQSSEANDFSAIGYADSGFSGSNFTSEYQQQQSAWGNSWGASSQGGYSSSSDEFMSPPKFFDEKKEVPDFMASFSGSVADDANRSGPSRSGPSPSEKKSQPLVNPVKHELEDKKDEKEIKKDDISFEWATALFKNYVPGLAENSSKMEVFLVIVEESIGKGDRMLVFSQSLLTLDLIEEYLQMRNVPGREEAWAKNRNYFRLDGSTPALEREKLINEFNNNENVQMFLVSTRAGSLGINLVGANRVVVFDASWNPCHDTQAVCRVYRYGQQKPCFVYRLVMDTCLEKKIYDRQVNKQGMADRIVDELNPDAHLALKDVTNLCWDDQEETNVADFSHLKDKYHDDIVKLLLEKHSALFSRAPFQHESLLVDRKEKKLTKADKKLAKRSYELEKRAATNPSRSIHQLFANTGARGFPKPIASVKPMQSGYGGYGAMRSNKWIPAEVWKRQGMSAQEMTLPLDVVIPTNSPDKTSIVLKAGQRVMVLKSPKGIYMQLDSGKIIAIRTSGKPAVPTPGDKSDDKKPNSLAAALKGNPNLTITKNSSAQRGTKLPAFLKPSNLDKQAAALNSAATKGRVFQHKGRQMPLPKKSTTPLRKPIDNMQATTPDDASPASQDVPDVDKNEPVVSETAPTDITVPGVQSEPLAESSQASEWGQAAMASTSGHQESANVHPEGDSSVKPQAQAQAPLQTPTNTPLDQPNLASGEYPPESKEVKKEADPQNPWGKPNYPMDPYGNYYPGYPGFYGPPMPGYDPYMAYPPMPPIKPEPSSDGTPPPAVPQQMPATRPPMYPPYHAPYPYHHYNYPPFPPQGQPGAAMPPTAPTVKSEAGEANTSGYVPPPYGPRPPYPQPSSAPPPGFYPNYPPYPPRPFHDPSYPYPNYNPYMPPAGYGYPVPNASHVNKPPADGGAPDSESSQ